MKRHIAPAMLGLAAILVSTPALAADVAPEAVQWEDDGSIAQSLTGTPGDADEGQKVMADRGLGNCYACHKIVATPDIPFMGNIGPELDGAGDRYDEAQLRGIVADAKHTFPDSMMVSFYKTSGYIRPGVAFTAAPAEEPLEPLLTAQQVEDVTAYLMTLK